jgi:plastocyanin
MPRPITARALQVGLLVSVLCVVAFASGVVLRASAQSTSGVTCPSAACVTVTIPSGASTPPAGYTSGTTTYGYTPDTITVVVGTNNTVLWTNDDAAPHTVTSDAGDPASFDSGMSGTLTKQGGTFQFTFAVPGTYHYHCSFHSWMQGTVIVLSGSSSSTTTSSPSASSPSASSGGVPEFPFQGALVAIVTLAVLASYLLARRTIPQHIP